jgi:hypothetical protein
MRAAGFRPLDPYPGSTVKPWRARCLKCGVESKPRLIKVRSGRACITCEAARKDAEREAHMHTFYAGAGRADTVERWVEMIPLMSDEWHGVPKERAEEEMRAAGFEPLEPYPQSVDLHWLCRCIVCGRPSPKRLVSIRTSAAGCRYCAPNAPVQPAAADADIRAAGFEPLEPYPGNTRTPWRCLCTTCGTQTAPRLEFVRRGSGCPICATARRTANSRLPSEAAFASARAVGFEPLEPYPGSNKLPWRCRCITCHRESAPRLTSIRQGSGCRHCAYGQPVDPEAEMRAVGFEPLEAFPGVKKPWRCRCTTCGNESDKALSGVRKGSGCRFCAGRPVDPEEEMRAAGFDPLEPYPGNAHRQWRCVCKQCGGESSPALHSVRRGTGCRFCARRLAADEAVTTMRAACFEPLEPYPGSKKPWRCRCTTCGNESSPHLSSVSKGSRCRYCARKGRTR